MAYTRVQGGTATPSSGATSTTIPITFAAVGNGNAVVGCVSWDSSSSQTVSGIADDKLNTYTVTDSVRVASDTQSTAFFYRNNITNGPVTVTVTFSATALARGMIITEFSGVTAVAVASAIDGHVANTQLAQGTTGDAVTSTAIATTVDGDLIWGASCNCGGGASPPAFGTGFTDDNNINISGGPKIRAEYLTQAAHASIAATFTALATSDFVSGVIALKPAAAATITLGGWDWAPQFPVRRKFQNYQFDAPQEVWPFTATSSATQYGWNNPEQFAERRHFQPLEPDQPPEIWPLTNTPTPSQHGWQVDAQFPARRRWIVAHQDDPAFALLGTVTPTQLGFLWEPQYPMRRRPQLLQPDEPTDQWPRTVAAPPLPLGWEEPVYQVVRRHLHPFLGDDDIIMLWPTASGTVTVRYIGPSFKRRRSRPPQ